MSVQDYLSAVKIGKNKKKCCNDKNSSSMNDKADRMENFRENQNVRVSENTGENSEMSFMEDMADNMNLPDKVQDVYVEASDENMQRSVNADDDKWVRENIMVIEEAMHEGFSKEEFNMIYNYDGIRKLGNV